VLFLCHTGNAPRIGTPVLRQKRASTEKHHGKAIAYAVSILGYIITMESWS